MFSNKSGFMVYHLGLPLAREEGSQIHGKGVHLWLPISNVSVKQAVSKY